MDANAPEPTDHRVRFHAVALPVLGLAAPVLAVVFGWQALALVFTLAGGTPPTSLERDQAVSWAFAAGLAAVALPMVALVLAVRTGGRLTVAVFATMTLVGLGFAVVVTVAFGLPARLDEAITPDPYPSSTPSVCQELSGGDTRCPGG